MPIINDIAEMRAYVRIDQNMSLSAIQPHVDEAVYQYIYPIMTQAVFGALVSAKDAAAPAAPAAPWDALLPSVEEAVTYYALMLGFEQFETHFGTQGVLVTDTSGVGDSNSEHRQASQRSKRELKQRYAERAYRAAEKVLRVLETNDPAWASWTGSEASTLRTSHIVQTTEQMRAVCPQLDSRKTFLAFAPYFKREESYLIKPLIGAAQYDLLIAALSGTPTPEELALLEKCRAVCVNAGALRALAYLEVEFFGSSLFIRETDAERKAVDMRRFEQLREAFNRDKEEAVGDLKNFIRANIDDYPEIRDNHPDFRTEEEEDGDELTQNFFWGTTFFT